MAPNARPTYSSGGASQADSRLPVTRDRRSTKLIRTHKRDRRRVGHLEGTEPRIVAVIQRRAHLFRGTPYARG
jgi:hypothetical protein